MRRRNKLKLQRRHRRKLFWLFTAALVCALFYTEQAAALYVLSILAICGLLVVVAFSNLEDRDVEMQAADLRAAQDDMSKNSRDLSTERRRAA